MLSKTNHDPVSCFDSSVLRVYIDIFVHLFFRVIVEIASNDIAVFVTEETWTTQIVDNNTELAYD